MSLPILLPNAVKAYRGDASSFVIQVLRNRKDPQPVDLTGYGNTWASQIRESEGSPLAASFAVDATNAATGILAFSLAGTIVSSLDQPLYWFDVQVTGGAQSPLTVFLGKIEVRGEITHA